MQQVVFLLLTGKNIVGVAGNLLNLELVLLFKGLLNFCSGHLVFQNELNNLSDFRLFYLFYFTLSKIDFFKFCLNLQSDLKYELPLLHSRLLFNANLNLLDYFSLGGAAFYLSSVKKVGITFENAFNIFEGNSKISVRIVNLKLKKKSVLLFLGDYFLSFFNSLLILFLFSFLHSKLKLNPQIVRTDSGLLNSLEVGLKPIF